MTITLVPERNTLPAELSFEAIRIGATYNQEPRRRGSRKRRAFVLVCAFLVGGCALAGVVLGRASNPSALSWQTAAVAAAANLPASEIHLSHVVRIDTNTGPRYDANVDGVGVVQLDAETHEVNELIYEARLGTPEGPLASRAAAVSVALNFANSHYTGFSSLRFRSVRLLDHKSFAEYRIQWQAERAGAWLPSSVTVGINARTGSLAYYYSQRVPLTINAHATVSAEAARQSALAAAGFGPGSTSSRPVLEVQVVRGEQQLVWAVNVSPRYPAALHVEQQAVVWVDGHSGAAEVVARG